MAAVCRLCMDESYDLVDIFEEKKSTAEEPSLLEMLTECIACKVDKNDLLPKKICSSCVQECKNAFRFKRISEQSYNLFMEMLSKPSCSGINQQPDLSIVKLEKEIDSYDAPGNASLKDDDDFLLPPVKVKSEIDSYDAADNAPLEDEDDFLLPPEKCLQPAQNKTRTSPCLAVKTVEDINKRVNQSTPVTTMKWCGGTAIPLGKTTKLSGKIYKCRSCSKEFFEMEKLHEHLKSHKDVMKPFRCRYCEEKFAKRSFLNLHIRNEHTANPFKCSECPKTFARKQHRDEHMSFHTGKRPYKCSDCSKEFRSNLGFKKHICLPAHNELRNAHLYINTSSPT
ncbi:hypothetical protein KR215_011380 [Drosophila sulfurigaster]|nr:hypothetical protein KR215_011380 [Drosophila sulfurigaster]